MHFRLISYLALYTVDKNGVSFAIAVADLPETLNEIFSQVTYYRAPIVWATFLIEKNISSKGVIMVIKLNRKPDGYCRNEEIVTRAYLFYLPLVL